MVLVQEMALEITPLCYKLPAKHAKVSSVYFLHIRSHQFGKICKETREEIVSLSLGFLSQTPDIVDNPELSGKT